MNNVFGDRPAGGLLAQVFEIDGVGIYALSRYFDQFYVAPKDLLGADSETVRRIADWCSAHEKAFAIAQVFSSGGYQFREGCMDVEDLDLISSSFDGHIAAAAKAEKARVLAGGKRTEKKPPRRDVSGFVYLVSGSDGVYKIGRTSSIKRRMDDFTKLPFETTLICTIPSPDTLALESSLHKKFAMKRLNGEWFRLGEKDVAYILGLAGAQGVES